MIIFVLQDRSPLWTASFYGHLEVVKTLIEAGAMCSVIHVDKVGVCVNLAYPELVYEFIF